LNLLHIDSSILGSNSVSRTLTAAIVARWRDQNPGVQVSYRDLATAPISYINGALFAARSIDPANRTPEQQREVAAADAIVEEFLAADVVVVGAPMYNFTIPGQLKTWIDYLAVAGKTFNYTAQGPVGLVSGKKVIIVSTRGGFYGHDTPNAERDFQEKYLTAVFGFFGITDIEFIRAEGVSIGPEHREKAIATAHETIAQAI
jgi:FMN-dependent NADH-azoreductase